MKVQFLNSPDDLQWLRDTCFKGVPLAPEYAGFQSAVVTGNEDAPATVDLYRTADPAVSDRYLRVDFGVPPFYCQMQEIDPRARTRSVECPVLPAGAES